MSRELLRLTKETTYGVYPTSPAEGTVLLLDVQQDNGYTVRPELKWWEIKSAAASNMVVKTGSNITDLSGKMTTYIRPGQAAWLMDLATTLVGTNCKDLGSFTADYGVFTEDGTCTAAYKRHLGCKIAAMTLSIDNSDQGSLLMGSFDIVAKQPASITVSDFAVPAADDYDNGSPYILRHTAGKVLLAAASRDPEMIQITVNNTLLPYRGNGEYISRLGWKGRTSQVQLRGLFLSAADRADYEAKVAKSLSIAFDDTVQTLTFDFGDSNLIKAVADDFKMGDWNKQTLTIQNFLDGPAGVDFTATLADDE